MEAFGIVFSASEAIGLSFGKISSGLYLRMMAKSPQSTQECHHLRIPSSTLT